MQSELGLVTTLSRLRTVAPVAGVLARIVGSDFDGRHSGYDAVTLVGGCSAIDGGVRTILVVSEREGAQAVGLSHPASYGRFLQIKLLANLRAALVT